MATTKESDRLKKVLKDLLKDSDNRICADCPIKSPTWASINVGVFVCMPCSGIHRSLGTHVSQVRSVDLDTWKQEWVDVMRQWGNAKANAYYEAKLPAGHDLKPSETEAQNLTPKMQKFIKDKYERRKWYGTPQATSTDERSSAHVAVDDGDVKPKKRVPRSNPVVSNTSSKQQQQPSSSSSKGSAPPNLLMDDGYNPFDAIPSSPTITTKAATTTNPTSQFDPFTQPVQSSPTKQFDPFASASAPLPSSSSTSRMDSFGASTNPSQPIPATTAVPASNANRVENIMSLYGPTPSSQFATSSVTDAFDSLSIGARGTPSTIMMGNGYLPPSMPLPLPQQQQQQHMMPRGYVPHILPPPPNTNGFAMRGPMPPPLQQQYGGLLPPQQQFAGYPVQAIPHASFTGMTPMAVPPLLPIPSNNMMGYVQPQYGSRGPPAVPYPGMSSSSSNGGGGFMPQPPPLGNKGPSSTAYDPFIGI